MARRRKRVELRLSVFRNTIQRDRYEQSIVAVNVSSAERLTVDWQYPCAFFARALRDQLFNPQTQCFQRLIDNESELVASGSGVITHRKSQLDRNVFRLRGLSCTLKQLAHVESHEGRGNHSKICKSGAASTDVSLV